MIIMEARELRIGNLVEYYIEDKIDERKAWWEQSVIDVIDLGIIEKEPQTHNFRAIPITQKWLNKFGFRKYQNPNNSPSWCFAKGGFKLIKNFHSGKIYFTSYFIEIKSVHQLQNLYFDLTGKELELRKDLENE
jgi:hypothetical protein